MASAPRWHYRTVESVRQLVVCRCGGLLALLHMTATGGRSLDEISAGFDRYRFPRAGEPTRPARAGHGPPVTRLSPAAAEASDSARPAPGTRSSYVVGASAASTLNSFTRITVPLICVLPLTRTKETVSLSSVVGQIFCSAWATG